MQSFVPTDKTIEPDVQASIQQQENGDFYVTITSVAENLGVESIEFFIDDADGIKVVPKNLALDNDHVYGNMYIDSDHNGFLSAGDFFIIQHKDNGGYGEVGGSLVLIYTSGNQVLLTAQLR